MCYEVNYLLSINAPLAKDRLIYADECLDLIDILRKEKNITHDQDLKDMEEAVLDIRDELGAMTVVAGGSSATGAVSGPTEPASSAVDAETAGQSRSEDDDETKQEATRRDVFNPDNVVLRFTSNSKVATPNPNAFWGQDIPKIESYLRDTWYPPRQETRPPPQPLPIRPKHAVPEDDTIDSPPASDPARPPSRQD